VRERTLVIEPGNSKTRRGRTMRLLGPVAQDLAEWRLAQGGVFPDRADLPTGQRPPLDADRLSELAPTDLPPRHRGARAIAAAVPLRHSFVSLPIQKGRDFREVARLAGHGPEVCARTYAHLFDEWDGAERVPAEEAIRRARQGRRRRAS
jgi:hypothetical protein